MLGLPPKQFNHLFLHASFYFGKRGKMIIGRRNERLSMGNIEAVGFRLYFKGSD